MPDRWQRLGGEVVRFLLGGVSTTLVSYAVYLLLLPHLAYLVAYAIAYATGIAWSYFANTLFVFRRKPSVKRALAFPLVYAAQYAIGSLLLVVLIDRLHIPAQLGPLLVVMLTLPLTYVISRWIITTDRTPSSILMARTVNEPISPARMHPGLQAGITRTTLVADCLVAAVIATAIAMYVFGAWSMDLHVPLAASGDATSAQYIFKSLLEYGTYVRNPDVGAPFGATMYDYPIPEPTHHLIIRLIGLFTRDPFLAYNIFYLLSFATAALTACWALQRNGIGRFAAIAGAVAFTLLPYHFFRIGHIFLASYFAIPILCHYALALATYRAPHIDGMPRIRWTSVFALALVAGTGVYYAFFGMLLIAVGAGLGATSSRHLQPLRVGAIYVAAIAGVVALSLAPNALYHLSEGANPLVAGRLPAEAEIYGLRITQLLLPTPGHRVPVLRELMAAYGNSAPVVNENMTTALGVIGSVGFLAAVAIFFFAGRRRLPEVWAAGALCVSAVLYATIGGFGALAARFAIPEIRGLNRICVFIAFLAIFAFLTLLRRATRSISNSRVELPLAAMLVAVAYVDQIPVAGLAKPSLAAFNASKQFFANLQSAVPAGTAIYELPYVYFPESPQPPGSYALLEPYLFTDGLRWSFGDMRGRASDQWNAQISELSGAALAGALARAHFGAIYVDRRGYTDRAAAVEKDLRAQFGAPIAEDIALARALYRVREPIRTDAPFVSVDLGRGWYPWEQAGDGMAWSRDSAELVVANPNDMAIPLLARFKLTTLVARKVTLAYGKDVLSVVQLKPGVSTDMSASFTAAAGVSRLSLTTDVPAQRPGGTDRRKLAFQITHLGYAPTTSNWPP